MDEVSIVGVDLAKQVSQVHGIAVDGRVRFRESCRGCSSRSSLLCYRHASWRWKPAEPHTTGAGSLPVSAMRSDSSLPSTLKPFAQRQKNDTADAEAIAEVAQRPTMRTVAVKTAAQQARAMLFRTRELLVGQRTQSINALRGHLAEHGIIVGKCINHIGRFVEQPGRDDLTELIRQMGQLYLDQIAQIGAEISRLDARIVAVSKESNVVRRVQQMPGIGPVTAMAITRFAPVMREFRRGRDFSAWPGLVPRQHSSGGKQKLGRTSNMGQRDIRRLLIIGAISVVQWRGREGGPPGSWLSRILAPKLIAIALANKMARMIWAMLARNEDYKDPAGTVCCPRPRERRRCEEDDGPCGPMIDKIRFG